MENKLSDIPTTLSNTVYGIIEQIKKDPMEKVRYI
jgi:hypothetical protein